MDHQPVTRRDYPTAGLTVHWDSDICIHSGVCSRTLPQVFRPREKPWIDADAADAAALAAAIDKCPSGALRYTRTDVEPAPKGELLLPPPAPEVPEAPAVTSTRRSRTTSDSKSVPRVARSPSSFVGDPRMAATASDGSTR